jgi:hypothetical protein
MMAHVDVDDLPKNKPIRIKGKRSSTHMEPELREVGKREDSKLAKVRGESIEGKE